MDLWVRTQDREEIVRVKRVSIFYNNIQVVEDDSHESKFISVGVYETKERALEILDEIQNLLKPRCLIKTNSDKLNRDNAKQISEAYKKIFDSSCIITNNMLDFEKFDVICYEMPKE